MAQALRDVHVCVKVCVCVFERVCVGHQGLQQQGWRGVSTWLPPFPA